MTHTPQHWNNNDWSPSPIEDLALTDSIRSLFNPHLTNADIKSRIVAAQQQVLSPTADTLRPYMCVLRFSFLVPRMFLHSDFQSIVQHFGGFQSIHCFVDLGCCMGADLFYLAKHLGAKPSSLLGLEYSYDFLKAGKILYHDDASNYNQIRFQQCDILLDLPKQKAQIIHAGSVLHTFENSVQIEQVCQHVYDMLLPGGCFFGSNRPDWIFSNKKKFAHCLEHIGFQNVVVKNSNFFVDEGWGPNFCCYKRLEAKL